jgi:3-oxoacyl-[acyl-carrier protein] reductase
MLARKKGNIVNISSTVADNHGRGVAVYSAMKSAVNRLTEVMAIEMGKKNIRVNSICPGVVETKMSNGLQDRHSKLLLEKTPLQRFATPEEIAKSALFLASDSVAAFITGHKLFVDGGIGLN